MSGWPEHWTTNRKLKHALSAPYDHNACCPTQTDGRTKERIPERSSHSILPMEGLAGKITSSLYMNTILRVITV